MRKENKSFKECEKRKRRIKRRYQKRLIGDNRREEKILRSEVKEMFDGLKIELRTIEVKK